MGGWFNDEQNALLERMLMDPAMTERLERAAVAGFRSAGYQEVYRDLERREHPLRVPRLKGPDTKA